MKKIIINIVLAVTTVFALSACEDFLDTKNLTQKTTENFPETEKDAQEMVTAIYAHLLFESPETSSQFYVAQLAGEDARLGGGIIEELARLGADLHDLALLDDEHTLTVRYGDH